MDAMSVLCLTADSMIADTAFTCIQRSSCDADDACEDRNALSRQESLNPFRRFVMRSPGSGALLVAAAVLLVSGPLAAQQPQHGQDTASGHQMMAKMDKSAECPMMSAMMMGPAAALGSSTALHLTSSQVSQLQALKQTLDQGHKAAMDSMMAIHRQINAIVQAPQFDEQAARAAFARMGALHGDMGLSMARAQHQVAGILTAQQEKSLAAIGQSKMGSGGMSGMSGMCSES